MPSTSISYGEATHLFNKEFLAFGGVLEITLPKLVEVKPKKISVASKKKEIEAGKKKKETAEKSKGV